MFFLKKIDNQKSVTISSSAKWLLMIGSALLLTACDNSPKNDNKIIFGFGPSAYATQVEEAIKPILEREGYEVETVTLSQNLQINPALKEKSIDVTGHQSTAYMELMNDHLDMEMVALTYSVGTPQSIRSRRHSSLDDVKPGMTVAIPNDPVNAERASRILEEIGWVKVKDGVNGINFTANDLIILNGIKMIELDSALGMRVLDDVDFAILNGNYVTSAGEKLKDGLYIENTPPEHRGIITIRKEDVNKPWAIAVKNAHESKEYEAYIKADPFYEGFIYPEAWLNN